MRTILKTALTWIILLILPLAAQAERVHLRGSFIVMERADGFVESPTLPGLIWQEAKAAVITTELPASSYGALSQELLAGKGIITGQDMELTTVEETQISGYPAIAGTGRQRVGVGTFEKWIILIGTPEAALLISAQMPTLFVTPSRQAAMEAVLASIAVAPERSDPLAALAFTFEETPRFKLTQVLSAYAIILTDSHLVADPASRAMFVIGTGSEPDCTLWQTHGKQAFAESLIQRLQSVKALEPLETAPAQFGASDGFRTETHGQVNGQRALVVQTVRFDGCRFARTIGIGPASSEAQYRQEFKTLADGVAWKTP